MQHPHNDFLAILRDERRGLLERLRKTRFSTLKAGYSHGQIIPHASYSPWLDDESFLKLFSRISPTYTLVDIYRCHELYALAQQLIHVPGDLVEVGVWRGGTAALIGSAASTKSIHLFDTFSGVAKASEHDTFYSGGEHSDTSVEVVKSLMRSLNLECHIHIGVFPDDTYADLPELISFAHIDVDTYQSAREACLTIWPRLSKSGVIVFDDYGFFGCEGVTQAVHELAAATPNAFFLHNLNGHAVLVKLDS